MAISKIDSNTKTNCKIGTVSLATGALVGAASMVVGRVTPKDVFQYKNLSKQQQKVAKVSGISAILIAVLTALNLKMINKNNQK